MFYINFQHTAKPKAKKKKLYNYELIIQEENIFK